MVIRTIVFVIYLVLFKQICADTVTTPIKQLGYGRVSCAAFSPDTQLFATGCFDNKLRIHDIETGDLVRTLTLPEKNKNFKQTWWIHTVSFSHDGKMLLSNSSDNKVLLWNTSTGELIQTFSEHDSGVCTAAISDDNKMVLSGGSDGSVRLWDVLSGAMVRVIQLEQSVYKYFPFVTRTGFSNNGGMCFYTSGEMTILVKLPEFKVVRSFTGDDVRFTPNDSAVIYTVEDSIVYLNYVTGESQYLYKSKSGKFNEIELSIDGTTLYVHEHTDDSLRNYIKKLDLSNRTVTNILAYKFGDPPDVYFSTEKKVCLTVSDHALVELHDLKSGKRLKTLEYYSSFANTIAISQDGKSAFIGYQFFGLKQWNIDNEKLVKSFFVLEPPIKNVDISNDNSKVIATYSDDTTRIWNVSDGSIEKKIYYLGDSSNVSSAEISSDGKKALIANRNCVDLWNIETGEILKSVTVNGISNSSPKPHILCLSFSPGDTLALVGLSDYSVRLLRISDGTQIMSYSGHKSIINSVAMSPDGSKIITSSVDSTAIVWNSRTHDPIVHILKGHSKIVTVAKFSHSGMFALTGSIDNTARLWDIATGQELRVFSVNHEYVLDVAFSPDDKNIIVGTTNGATKLFDITDLQNTSTSVYRSETRTFLLTAYRDVISFRIDCLTMADHNAYLDIVTISGKLVARYTITTNTAPGIVNVPIVNSLGNGMYYCRFKNGKNTRSGAFFLIR